VTILAEAALKSTLLLAGAWVVSLLLRRRPAAWRHVVWCAALAAVAALPLLTAMLPVVRFPVPDAFDLAGAPLFSTTAVASSSHGAAPPVGGGMPRPATPTRPAPGNNWGRWIAVAWAAGTALMLAHLSIGHLRMALLRRRAVALQDPAWLADFDSAARVLGVSRPVALLESAEAGVPVAAGILRPAVCIPSGAREWDGERRRMVLLHEIAHVLRNDPVTHLAARLALCLYWFHPLAWMSVREFLRERERACDDLVLEAGARPSQYAGHLLDVAASMTPAPAGWAGVWMARKSQLEGRLVSILDAKAKRGAVGPAFTAAAALAALLVTMPVAAMRPEPQSAPATAAEMETLIRNAISARDHAMIEQTMKTLLGQRKFQDAEKLAGAALSIREQKYGPNSAEFAQGLVQQADIQGAAGNKAGVEASYARLATLQNAGDAKLMLVLARAAAAKKQYEKAADLSEQAAAKAADAATRAEALTWLGLAREQLADLETAEQKYQQAVQAAEPDTLEHASALEMFARLLRTRGRVEEAAASETRAREIRRTKVRGPAGAPLPAGAPSGHRVGGAVLAPKLMHKVEPQYTELARAAKVQGQVKLTIVVGPDGRPHRIELMAGLGLGLDEQAVDAVSQWRFQPGTKDGQPVSVAAVIEVHFRLL
jgi:TonB family protein